MAKYVFVTGGVTSSLGKGITYSTLVTDRDGKLLRPFITRDGYWRLPVTADDVDPRFLAMLIAYEDKRFHDHGGVDPWALLRAAWQAATHARIVSGGSTLTMQLARLLEPIPHSGLGKIKQINKVIVLAAQFISNHRWL